MMQIFVRVSLLTLLLAGCSIPAVSGELDSRLRRRIESAGSPPRLEVNGDAINASIVLPLFYERRIFAPAWVTEEGPTKHADPLREAIVSAREEGLNPRDYHLERIDSLAAIIHERKQKGDKPNPGRLIDFELLCTDAYLIYGSHLLSGKIDPQTIDAEWFANRREADLAAVLEGALDADRVKESLSELLPPQAGYQRLKQRLADYHLLEESGGWQSIPEGPKLEKGSSGARVRLLRDRLVISEDLKSGTKTDRELFDEETAAAVKRFQGRHGLDDDGVVGPKTLNALNLPLEDRARRLEVNMERWRWLPQQLGKTHILVNIAGYELDVVENAETAMTMRVIVGKDYRRTPVFSDQMTYLVFSPYWNVPHNIATQDILPKAKANPQYLVDQSIRVFRGWGADAQPIDPLTINWNQYTQTNYPFRLRQDPGPKNALGVVKFMFPNQFNVYLHDTSARELFSKTDRAFSSGCIRIQKPLELAEYVLKKDPKWTRERIDNTIAKRVEETVKLPEPIRVHLLYWTAWVDEAGLIQFREDVYDRDGAVLDALSEVPPSLN